MNGLALRSQIEWQTTGLHAAFARKTLCADDKGLGVIEVHKPAGYYPDPPVQDFTLIEVVRGKSAVGAISALELFVLILALEPSFARRLRPLPQPALMAVLSPGSGSCPSLVRST